MSQYPLRAAFAAGFVAVIVGFHVVQPYRLNFFSQEQLLQISYSLGRLIFCGFYFAILFSIGNLLLSLVSGRVAALALSPLEEIAISVVCGSAVLRLGMLILGFAGLYQWLLLAAIGTLFVWLGVPNFVKLIRSIASSTRQAWTSRHPDRAALIVISAALIASCAIVVTFKFLLPNGTGDYFSHYLPYFEAVTTRGGIWPNEIWYHFFLSKGAGDTFFAIVLSDLLGPLTVSCAMFFTALVIMYCMIRSGGQDPVIALAGTAITAAGFIWTVETSIGFKYWAEFAKEHVDSAVLFFGCFWAVWRQKTMPAGTARSWVLLTATAFVGLVLLRVQFAAIVLLFLGIVSGWEYFTGNKRDSKARIIPAVAVLVAAAALLVVNYVITGLAEVTPFRTFWKFADQERFSQWVSPFLMLLLDLGSSADLGSVSPPDLGQFPTLALLAAVFRLDRLSPFLWPFGMPLIGTLILTLAALRKRPEARQQLRASYAGVSGAVFLSAALAFFSVNQIGSLFRVYMFMMFPVIALASLPFAISRSFANRTVRIVSGLFVAVLTVIAPIVETSKIPRDERNLAWHFLVGEASIADAYASQNAVWPAAVKMASIVGPESPIWISQVGWHFCVAPTCNLQSFFSFSMGKQWATIMFDSPAAAKAALQEEGINYFAVDTSAPFFDLLPYSPLFRPETIGKHLGVLWTDGTVYLLTWRSDRTNLIPEKFYDAYRTSIESARKFADFEQLYARLADIFTKWRAHPQWPVTLDDTLPRIRGWQ